MILQLLIIVFVIWFSNFQRKQRPFKELAKKFPSNITSYPIIGHSYMLLGRDVVGDPVAAQFICNNSLTKGDLYEFFKILTGNGSVFAPAPIWRPRRKIVAPTFSPKNLNNFVQIFSEQSRIMVELLKPKAGQGTFSVWEYMTTYTMDSVCETILGIKMNVQNQRNHPFLEGFETCCLLMSKRIAMFWKHNEAIYRLLPEYQTLKKACNVLVDFTDEIVKNKRKEIEQRKNSPLCDDSFQSFLELSIDSSSNRKSLTNEELREECLVLILAGTDTSAVGASFTLLILSIYPNVQEKVFEELREIFRDDWNRPIVAEDLPKMKYLDAVIKESLRMYPPVPLIIRKITEPLTLPTGETLFAGVNAVINLWGINRHPKYWGPDADEFKPERFFEPLKCPPAFASFSYNPRNCLGYQYAMLSAKTVIASVIRSYKVLPAMDPKYSHQTPCIPSEPIETTFQIMMKDVNHFRLGLKCRK